MPFFISYITPPNFAYECDRVTEDLLKKAYIFMLGPLIFFSIMQNPCEMIAHFVTALFCVYDGSPFFCGVPNFLFIILFFLCISLNALVRVI